MKIEEFEAAVNKVLRQKVGLTLQDLADFSIWEYFEEDMDPAYLESQAEEAAYDALRNDGMDQDLLNELFDYA